MAKTLNELTLELKTYILDAISDPRSKIKVKPYEYNSLDLKIDLEREDVPHVIISLGISEAIFDIHTGKKITGGLGPDERYVLKWLEKGLTQQKLHETWRAIEKVKRKSANEKPQSKFR